MPDLAGALPSAVHAAVSSAARLRSTPKPAADGPARAGELPEKDWTVLVYMEGRDRLAWSSARALRQLASVGSSPEVGVAVQSTIQPTLMERLQAGMRGTPTQRWTVGPDGSARLAGDLGEQKRLDRASLADFVAWGVKRCPAKHYLLVVKKHGQGFAKSERVPLSARELGQALGDAERATGRKMDVVAFDACAMEQMEVAYELKDHAAVMTGSEEDVYAVDFPYDRVLEKLRRGAAHMSAQDVGRAIVEAHRERAPRAIQTAVELGKLGAAAASMHALVDAVRTERTPRDVVYTNMLKAPSLEPSESMHFAYDFRDLRGFLQALAADARVASARVRAAATQADRDVAAAVIDHAITDGKRRQKDAQGLTTFTPWQAPASDLASGYARLAWNRDATWNRLLDYVFEEHVRPAGTAATPAPASTPTPHAARLGLASALGKAAVHQYKKYVSPYLTVVCRCHPTCSQYTREAIERFGLVEGTRLGFMRLLTCAGADGVIDDPVPAKPGQRAAVPPPAPEVLIAPPPRVEKSPLRTHLERMGIGAAHLAGMAAGGAAGALAALPFGLALGAVLGWKAGRAAVDDMNRSLLTKYRHESVRELVHLEHAAGDPGFAIYRLVDRLTGSPAAARAVGGAVGAACGATLGALGAGCKGLRMGGRFGALWAGNALKDRLGELPRHPYTENILHRDYA